MGTRGIFENCCLTSLGTPCWSTGLFAAGSAMLRLCTVLNSPGWLVSVGVKASVQRTGFRVVREGDRREKQESPGAQERVLHTGALF